MVIVLHILDELLQLVEDRRAVGDALGGPSGAGATGGGARAPDAGSGTGGGP